MVLISFKRRGCIMKSNSRLGPRLVLAGVALGVCGIGWVTRSSLAQDPPVPRADSARADGRTLGDKVLSAPSPVELRESAAATPFDAVAPTFPADLANPTSPIADPEKAALAFAEENQKQAETQLKALKEEEAKLKARLQKVESGIRRWESLLTALKQSQGSPDEPPLTKPSPRVDIDLRKHPVPQAEKPRTRVELPPPPAVSR